MTRLSFRSESLLVFLVAVLVLAAWSHFEIPGRSAPILAASLIERGVTSEAILGGLIRVLLLGLAGAGVACIYYFRRMDGLLRGEALVGALVGGLSAPVLHGLAEGLVGLLAAGVVAPALVLASPKGGRPGWAAMLVFLAAVLDARVGLACGLACGLVAGGAAGGLLAVWGLLVAGGEGQLLTDPMVLDLGRIGEVFLQSAGPGLAVLAGLGLVVGRDRWLGLGLLLLAMGPVLLVGGAPLKLGVYTVYLPGILVYLASPSALSWGGFLVVAGVVVGLGLRVRGWKMALVGLLWLVDGGRIGGLGLPGADLSTPLVVGDLAGQPGKVLALPVEISQSEGHHARYALWSAVTGRSFLPGRELLGATSALYGEPAVVLALDATYGLQSYLIPPTRPGAVLNGLDITHLIVCRSAFSAEALELLDALYTRWFGAPQKDVANQLDVYRIPIGTPAPIRETTALQVPGSVQQSGWKNAMEYLKDQGHAPGAKGPGKPGGKPGTKPPDKAEKPPSQPQPE